MHDGAIAQLCEYFQATQTCNDAAEAINNNPVVAIGTIAVGLGAVAYLGLQQVRKTQRRTNIATTRPENSDAMLVSKNSHFARLIEALKAKDETKALGLIDELTTAELNMTDINRETPLYLSFKMQGPQVATKLTEKFLKEKVPMNVMMPNGKSIFQDLNYAKKLISTITSSYREYACSDVSRFPGNINPELSADKKQSIKERKSKNVEAEKLANNVQPLNGSFTRKQIEQCAKAIEKSKSAACTGFALSVADKLLILFPDERIQLISHEGGFRGTHVYVVVNHTGREWNINKLQTITSLHTTEAQNKIGEVVAEFENTLFVDTWLASLGWGKGVFILEEYINMKQNCHFIFDGHCTFDSKSIDKSQKLSF